jgi:hypothetical protein
MGEPGKILEFRKIPQKSAESENIEEETELAEQPFEDDEEIKAIEEEHLDVDNLIGDLRTKIVELNLNSKWKKLEAVNSQSLERIKERDELMLEVEACEMHLQNLINRAEKKLALTEAEQKSASREYINLAKGQEKQIKIEAKEKYGQMLKKSSYNRGNLSALLIMLYHMEKMAQKLKKEVFRT